MDKQTQAILDFPKILSALDDLCLSEEGRSLMAAQTFFTEAEPLSIHMDLVADFRMLLESGEGTPAFDFPPFDFLEKAAIEGSVLEGIELASLGRYIRSAQTLRGFLQRTPENRNDFKGILKEQGDILPDLAPLEREIFSNLDTQGEVLDNHPAIKPIKRAIERINKDINTIAYSFLHKDQNIWQAEVPTQRDGRTVLPLKADYRGKVKGIVHEVSGRGATLFIEPIEIVEKNNQLAMEENRLRMEIQRILRELSVRVREDITDCRRMKDQVAYIDTLYARARYAGMHKCSRPEIRERGFQLKQAVHPGLGPSAVPINIELPNGTNQLIITGPNTGGKTVSLKTVGLFVMMHQFGMEIPVDYGSSMALMSGVFADIGDEQSIEESLSTYSGHMRRLSFIMDHSDHQSLVLLDELGGGTDPHEGAAMAMAILDWFGARNTMVVITTHLGVMKNYGYTREGCSNASVTFDDTTLRPTYHILQGIPGESHALEIAAANGMNRRLIDDAEKYLQGEESDVAAMIKQLQENQNRLRDAEMDLKKTKQNLEEERRKVDLKDLRLKQKELEIREGQYGDLRHYVRDSRKALENLVSDLRSGNVTKEKTLKVKEFIGELTKKEQEASESLDSDLESMDEATREVPEIVTGQVDLVEGMDVLVGPNKKPGLLVRKDKKGKWLVAVGTLKMTLPVKDLIPVKPKKKKMSVTHSGSGGKYAVMELDLRGMRFEEALKSLERQIDDALLAGMTQFSVIHGLGEGILQKGVHDYLRSSSPIKKFGFAHPDSGGFGKTEVELR